MRNNRPVSPGAHNGFLMRITVFDRALTDCPGQGRGNVGWLVTSSTFELVRPARKTSAPSGVNFLGKGGANRAFGPPKMTECLVLQDRGTHHGVFLVSPRSMAWTQVCPEGNDDQSVGSPFTGDEGGRKRQRLHSNAVIRSWRIGFRQCKTTGCLWLRDEDQLLRVLRLHPGTAIS